MRYGYTYTECRRDRVAQPVAKFSDEGLLLGRHAEFARQPEMGTFMTLRQLERIVHGERRLEVPVEGKLQLRITVAAV